MNYFPLTTQQQEWKDRVANLAAREIGPRAAEYDRLAQYPKESLNALRDAGLWALRVAREHGGLGGDLVTTCLVVEEIAKHCPSTAMCYKMHLEATELVTQIPTPYQVKRFVKPLARGELFATIAGGETAGAAGNDWRPNAMEVATCRRVDGGFQLENIRKSYVTSAGHATHYLMLNRLEGRPAQGMPDFLMVERDHVEWKVLGEWNGLGMRGNSSSPMLFNGVVPQEHRLGIGREDEPVIPKYMMPLLILTYGAAYLGIASGAYALGCQEATKRFASGARRLDAPINQRRFAEMSAQIEAARTLLHAAAAMADSGRAPSIVPYIQAKVLCSEAAVRVTQDLMTIFGGTAFAARLPFERYFRDARAGMVMGMANDQAYELIANMLFPKS
ncbi:MAG: acyl-CoA dehydrogenase family protein [Candidatus Binatia bacterium]